MWVNITPYLTLHTFQFVIFLLLNMKKFYEYKRFEIFLSCRFFPPPNVSETDGHLSTSDFTGMSQGRRKLLPGRNPGSSKPKKPSLTKLFFG